jgi:DNA-binding MarR family transcriptional regulator
VAMPATTTSLAADLMEGIGGVRRGLRRAAPADWPRAELTGAQTELIRLVRREPGLSVREAAERLRLRPNTVSTLVGQLGAAGWVEREPHPDDRRVARLRLTSSASRRVSAWRDEREAVLGEALERLTPADRRALVDALGPLERLAEELHG